MASYYLQGIGAGARAAGNVNQVMPPDNNNAIAIAMDDDDRWSLQQRTSQHYTFM